MSKWAEMSDKEKTQLVLQHVMGCFILETSEHPRGLDAVAAGFHWPIAFWDEGIERWMTRDIATDPVIFNPLHSMDAAWLLVKKMQIVDANWYFPDFVNALVSFADENSAYCLLEAITPERICLASLKACGVGIE